MRNINTPVSATPVRNWIKANTFSGRNMDGLWVSRAQVRGLSPAPNSRIGSVWETPAGSTQETLGNYTAFTTTHFGHFSDEGSRLYPQSTGPIKIDSKVYKENRS